MISEPPTIAHLKDHGLEGLFITCANPHCLHAAPFTFVALGLADDLPFPSIARRRQFLCTQCGGRAVNVSPDWRAHRAYGAGRI
ncbi:MAG: hypothetical protein WCF20_10845 [Methylovirgula sp.]